MRQVLPGRSPDAILALLALASHAAAAALYLASRPGLALPPEWDIQLWVLLCLSLAATLYAALRRGTGGAKGALAVALVADLLACYPLPFGAGLQFALALPLVMTATAAFERPEYFFAGPGIACVFLWSQTAGTFWGVPKPGATGAEYLLLGTAIIPACALAIAARELDRARAEALAEVRRLDRAIDRIAEVNMAFQASLASSEEEYARKERNRITREIHDIVGYALTNQQMMLEAALMLAEPGATRQRELLAMARDGVAEGLRETRRTLYGLRGTDAARSPDLNVLLKITRNFEAVTGVRVSVDFADARGDLDQAAWSAVFRTIQEGMINSFRHGKARNISIFFREDERDLRLTVRDDGEGGAVHAEGIGLAGMRERLAMLGGELEAGDTGGGFCVSARIPKRSAREEP